MTVIAERPPTEEREEERGDRLKRQHDSRAEFRASKTEFRLRAAVLDARSTEAFSESQDNMDKIVSIAASSGTPALSAIAIEADAEADV